MAPESRGDQAREVPAELLELARRPDEVTAFRLWAALRQQDREEAVRSLLEARPKQEEVHRENLLETIAENFHFRKETLQRWDADRLAGYGQHLQVHEPPLLSALLRALHVYSRRELLRDFLDLLDIPNEDGLLKPEPQLPEVSAKRMDEAATEVLERHGAGRALPYFLTLVERDAQFAHGLDAWLEDWTSGDGRQQAVLHEESAEKVPRQAPGSRRLETTNEFTTMDRLFVRAVADVGQGIEGALTEDQLEDAVGELLALNSSRHKSFFHAGFMDSELRRDPREELRAQNPDRLRWYWAGYLSGLARREEHKEIVEHFDDQKAVRELGGTADGASHAAARLVFEALCQCERPGDAVSFLGVETVVGNPVLLGALKRKGTALLRQDKAAEAHGIFDLLGDVVQALEDLGVDTTTPRFLEIRRRRAHCYRQLDEVSAARRLLERLLEEERDPEIRSMVHTDLGIIEAGFRRLADLRIPDTPDQMEAFLEALEEGEPQFRQGAEMDVEYAAHGHHCLGVMQLLREEYDAAVEHLDRARARFEASPERYAHGGLLANARAYLGIAIFLALDTGRMERATELVRDGIRADAAVPRHFVKSIVEAADIRSPELARELAESFLDAYGEQVLDLLVDSDVARRSAKISDGLLQRARRGSRGDAERARDHRRVLPMLLAQERVEDAASSLDYLEGVALRGIGRHEFVGLVADPESYEPAWDVEDATWARLHCLESAGDYEEAAGLLEEEFHTVLARQPFGTEETARGLIDQIDSYGLEGDRTAHLERRLEEFREHAGEEVAAGGEVGMEEDLSVRILFVGGDERQESHQEAVRSAVQERDSEIKISFYHPGWGSNWGNDLDRVQQVIPRHDGLVIMRFIRTEFGRQLRKDLDIPWYACTTAGRRSMTESIVRAAELARRQLRARAEGSEE